MHILATDEPFANQDGDRITITIPSGNDEVTISLDIHQAMKLARWTQRKCTTIIEEANSRAVPACAQIIAFPKALPSLAARETKIANILRAAKQLDAGGAA
ncbi:hypothetical protein [Aurantiacibacter zhengii]|uniref:Uncharacterized protein n=1 Tax=Aurantiacibacter zhengii TaxID=2307003 RepID=A0A418NNI7_9SPHN|nr:hypothetical protein [Aurantiacibacter zhengii]RIV83374.1 hypothetical protein D2V07_16630 [Aurantiacibacter zhengii]